MLAQYILSLADTDCLQNCFPGTSMQFHLFIIYLCKGQILIYDISFFAQIRFSIFLMYSSPCHNVIHDIFSRITSIFKSNIFCIIPILLSLPKSLFIVCSLIVSIYVSYSCQYPIYSSGHPVLTVQPFIFLLAAVPVLFVRLCSIDTGMFHPGMAGLQSDL